ncbi:hypothetical protein U1Q18_007526 [Sarracenia purpurea var. burkii]
MAVMVMMAGAGGALQEMKLRRRLVSGRWRWWCCRDEVVAGSSRAGLRNEAKAWALFWSLVISGQVGPVCCGPSNWFWHQMGPNNLAPAGFYLGRCVCLCASGPTAFWSSLL